MRHFEAPSPARPTGSPERQAGRFALAQLGADWRAARGAIIALHGRDRAPDELPSLFGDLIDKGRWRVLMPTAPRLSWYKGRFNDEPEINAPGRFTALLQIEKLMALAADHGIAAEKTVLVGFSQGGCLVTEYILHCAPRPGGAAIFTGSQMTSFAAQPGAQCSGLPVVLTGGDQDPWLPAEALFATRAALERAGADVRFQTFRGADHVVRPEEIALLGALCTRVLESN